MAKGAYAAYATLAAARGMVNPAESPFRQALTELIRAAGLVRRIGVNLNQAVAKLNATGQRSADLLPYAAESLRRAERLESTDINIRGPSRRRAAESNGLAGYIVAWPMVEGCYHGR
jgi:hypothetical protein